MLSVHSANSIFCCGLPIMYFVSGNFEGVMTVVVQATTITLKGTSLWAYS